MKVVICGSRWKAQGFDWGLDCMQAIAERFDRLPQDTLIITGGADGADSWAHAEAGHRGFARQRIRAEWKRGPWTKRGKNLAGIIRNRRMLDEQPDLVIAFWDGKSAGTRDTIDEARLRGIDTEVILVTP